MGRARHDVSNILMFGQNLRQRLNDVFDSLVWREQAEGEQYCFPFHAKAVFEKFGSRNGRSGTPCGTMSILLPGTLKISCRNWDESWLMTISGRKALRSLPSPSVGRDLARAEPYAALSPRHLQTTQQMQNVASGRTAEDSILVLQAHHVDVVEVQKFSGFLIGRHVVLGERPAHPRGIVVAFFRVVDWERQQSSRPALRGMALHRSVVNVAIPQCRGR
jgi:hypothetical protein